MIDRTRRIRRRGMAAGLVALALTAVACSSSSSSTQAGTPNSNTTGAGGTSGALGQDPKNPKLYHGAGGFELDLSKCPAEYNPTQGITATDITVAVSLPKSGPAQGFGLIADGMDSYFKYINDQGGVAGTKGIAQTVV